LFTKSLRLLEKTTSYPPIHIRKRKERPTTVPRHNSKPSNYYIHHKHLPQTHIHRGVILAKNEYPDKIIKTEICKKFVKNRERIESVLAAAQDENNNDVFVPTSESEQVSQAAKKPKEKKQKKYIVLPYSKKGGRLRERAQTTCGKQL
jgi:hypothetical protein